MNIRLLSLCLLFLTPAALSPIGESRLNAVRKDVEKKLSENITTYSDKQVQAWEQQVTSHIKEIRTTSRNLAQIFETEMNKKLGDRLEAIMKRGLAIVAKPIATGKAIDLAESFMPILEVELAHQQNAVKEELISLDFSQVQKMPTLLSESEKTELWYESLSSDIEANKKRLEEQEKAYNDQNRAIEKLEKLGKEATETIEAEQLHGASPELEKKIKAEVKQIKELIQDITLREGQLQASSDQLRQSIDKVIAGTSKRMSPETKAKLREEIAESNDRLKKKIIVRGCRKFVDTLVPALDYGRIWRFSAIDALNKQHKVYLNLSREITNNELREETEQEIDKLVNEFKQKAIKKEKEEVSAFTVIEKTFTEGSEAILAILNRKESNNIDKLFNELLDTMNNVIKELKLSVYQRYQVDAQYDPRLEELYQIIQKKKADIIVEKFEHFIKTLNVGLELKIPGDSDRISTMLQKEMQLYLDSLAKEIQDTTILKNTTQRIHDATKQFNEMLRTKEIKKESKPEQSAPHNSRLELIRTLLEKDEQKIKNLIGTEASVDDVADEYAYLNTRWLNLAQKETDQGVKAYIANQLGTIGTMVNNYKTQPKKEGKSQPIITKATTGTMKQEIEEALQKLETEQTDQ